MSGILMGFRIICIILMQSLNKASVIVLQDQLSINSYQAFSKRF